jgi:Mce-associated membrane protein
MSPRRKVIPGEEPLFTAPPPTPPRQWGLPLVTAVAVVLMAAAITVSTLMLISHESNHSSAMKDVAALSYVRSFMTRFTSVDPFHANDYVQQILDQATGDFAKQYQAGENEILVTVARAEPTKGTVLDIGVERWNDDGSANVLVATVVASKSPDGKQEFENTNRWMVTAKQEGNQWKISSLLRVI